MVSGMQTTSFSLTGADVLVVGAGTGGMTAALLFADAGASVTLLERVADPAQVGAGILLQPNGIAVLAALGLHDALLAAGRRLPGEAIRSGDGRPILPVTTPDYGNGLDHTLAIHRGHLNDILMDAVRHQPAIETRFGAEVTAAGPSGFVDLRWHGVTSTITADLVVGADGLHSTIRACGDFAARTRHAGGPYLRGVLNEVGLGLQGEYWTPLGLFGGAQLDDKYTYFYADTSGPTVTRAVAQHDLGALADAWAEALPLAGQVLSRVSGFDDLLLNDAARVDCARWSDGRLVLLGDAVHAMAPTLGQGANSAIVDAAVLVRELATSTPLPMALARYTNRRRPAVRKVQNSADRLVTLSTLRNATLRRTRDTALQLINRVPGLTERFWRTSMQEQPAHLYHDVAQRRSPR
jgi:2-polyprenyl-6-methoxyphenol hydroxylase-like FAD-dependent oxidoreductase